MWKYKFSWIRLAAAPTLISLLATEPSAAQIYSVTTVTSSTTFANSPQAMNDYATVVGSLTRGGSITSGSDPQAYVWNASQLEYLDALHNQAGTEALAINLNGQVAGQSCATSGSGGCAGVLWNGEVPTDLGDFVPTAFGPSGVLYGDIIVGFESAAVWNEGTAFVLPLPVGGSYSEVTAANPNGQIVGDFFQGSPVDPNAESVEHAILWQGQSIYYTYVDLGPNAYVRSISETGVLAGFVTTNGSDQAVVWNNLVQTSLPTLGGASSQALSTNDFGSIVGYAELPDGSKHATLWTGGAVVDLDQVITSKIPPSVTAYSAQQIDDAGVITVVASDSATGAYLVYLLTPAGYSAPTAAPNFSVSGRTYASPQTLALTDTTAKASIYFTTDGTSPTTSSNLYAAPIAVTTTSTIKAIATAPGDVASAAASATYTIAAPAAAPPMVDLTPTDNVYAVATVTSKPNAGGVDGFGDAVASDLLGSSLNWGGSEFTFAPAGTLDATSNATIHLTPGYYSTLNVLAMGVNGDHPGETFTVTYTDGSRAPLLVSLSDWAHPKAYPGEAVALLMAHRVTPTGTVAYGPYHLYGYSLPIDATKQVSSLITPNDKDIVVFGVAEANAKGAAQLVSLSNSFNITGVYSDGQAVTGGGLDQLDNAYSEALLGTALSWNGSLFQLGSAGVPDAVSGATIALPSGQFSTLELLATAIRGNEPSQSFEITYTDGSSQLVSQSLSDWHMPQHYAGESIAASMAYRVDSSGSEHTGPYNLYGYALALNSSKTVKSISLPSSRDVVVLAITLVP